MLMAAAGNGAPPARKWLTLDDLAAARGVSKQAIHKRVQRLAGQKLLKTKKGPRGSTLVNVDEFDRQAERTVDAVRSANGKRSAAGSKPDGSLAAAQARRADLVADLKQIELEEKLGKLLPIAEIKAAMVRCAESLIRVADQMPMQADDLAAVVAKDGVTGARRFLKKFVTNFRAELAAQMQVLAAED